MEVLHDVQQRLGWLSRESVKAIAAVLNLSVAEVHGVVALPRFPHRAAGRAQRRAVPW